MQLHIENSRFVNPDNHDQEVVRGRGLKRRPYGSYKLSIERRAVVAAGLAEQNGWPTRQTAGLLCVSQTYVNLVRRLDKSERVKLTRGELKLARLHKEHLQQLAERRAQRLAAEREAKVQAEREEQARAVDTVLETVSIDRVVERIVAHFGPEPLLEELDILLQRNGRDLSQLILRVCDREKLGNRARRVRALPAPSPLPVRPIRVQQRLNTYSRSHSRAALSFDGEHR
jgi:hypothetical protein